ncbi:hypothetical protein [Pseudomonas citri]|uniref:hypothetical protein n=1 Tax=Pseudomonas citri TaxID=2978349 RepID=UPI0021B6894D|nr:hypothetical protein [Pseudomonas citri]
MGKRHLNPAAWQWRLLPGHHHPSTSLLIAVPLLIIACLLMVLGVFSSNLADIAIGIISVIAALGLQRHDHEAP